jgi:hypothetical protein
MACLHTGSSLCPLAAVSVSIFRVSPQIFSWSPIGGSSGGEKEKHRQCFG